MATATYEVITSNGNKLAVVTLTNPPVNSLSAGVRTGIQNAAEKARNDPEIKGVIVRGANGVFCAGADITEFKNMTGKLIVGQNPFPKNIHFLKLFFITKKKKDQI